MIVSLFLFVKLFNTKNYHSYSAQTYFLGIKVHRMITKEGIPIECIFTPGAEADMANKACNDYLFEDQLKDLEFI